MSRPSAAVPRPGGRPVPSGGMVISMPRISSGVGVRPRPYFPDCAQSGTQARSRSTTVMPGSQTSNLRRFGRPTLHIGDPPIGHQFPGANAVVVIIGTYAARGDQFVLRRLHVASFIGGAGCDDSLVSVPAPGKPETRESQRKSRLLQLGPLPIRATVG